jgi:hypothetical protein
METRPPRNDANLFRFLYVAVSATYLALQVALYSTSFATLLGYFDAGSPHGVAVRWNAFKPLLSVAMVATCTGGSIPTWRCALYLAAAFAATFGSLYMTILMTRDVVSVSNRNGVDPAHPSNDPLYCCVYYNVNDLCRDMGPCSLANESYVSDTVPSGNNLTYPVSGAAWDLKLNPEFKLSFGLFLSSFFVELAVVVLYSHLLRFMGTADGVFEDSVVRYSLDDLLSAVDGPAAYGWDGGPSPVGGRHRAGGGRRPPASGRLPRDSWLGKAAEFAACVTGDVAWSARYLLGGASRTVLRAAAAAVRICALVAGALVGLARLASALLGSTRSRWRGRGAAERAALSANAARRLARELWGKATSCASRLADRRPGGRDEAVGERGAGAEEKEAVSTASFWERDPPRRTPTADVRPGEQHLVQDQLPPYLQEHDRGWIDAVEIF